MCLDVLILSVEMLNARANAALDLLQRGCVFCIFLTAFISVTLKNALY